MRIICLDKLNFPISPPPLDALLAGDHFPNIAMTLKVDEQINAVALCKIVGFTFSMLMNPLDQIVGHIRVQRAVSLARQYVHEVKMLTLHGHGSRIGR